jgi:hypothetical protein
MGVATSWPPKWQELQKLGYSCEVRPPSRSEIQRKTRTVFRTA